MVVGSVRGFFLSILIFSQSYSFAQQAGSGGIAPPGANLPSNLAKGGAMPSGSSQQPSPPLHTLNFVESNPSKYDSCSGSKTQKVLNSIKEFKSMINQMKNTDQCQYINETLNEAVPTMQHATQAVVASGMAQTIKREKEKLRDIDLEIKKLEEHSSTSRGSSLSGGGGAAQLGGFSQHGKLQDLKNEKAAINQKLTGLEGRFAVGEKAQVMKQYEQVIHASDALFNQMGQAFNENCFDAKAKEQVAFSMTGILGMIVGASPLGIGLSVVSRFMKAFASTDDSLEATDSNKAMLFEEVKCAMQNAQNQHCEFLKAQELKNEAKTEAQACTDSCNEWQNQESFGNDIQTLVNIANKAKADNNSATEFYNAFTKGGSAKQSLNNLKAFVDILNDEADFLSSWGTGENAECDRNPNSYKCAALDEASAMAAIAKIKSTHKALNANGIKRNGGLQQAFMKEVKELNTGDNLKNFINLVLAYSNYQVEKAKTYNQEDKVASVSKYFQYINNRNVSDFIDVQTIVNKYKKEEDQMTAEMFSNQYMNDFSRIFSKKALTALENLEEAIAKGDANPELKNRICMQFIGLKPVKEVQSTQNDIDKKCQDAKVQIVGQVRLKYGDYIGKDFKDKVCAYQNALNCADGELGACSAHERISSSQPQVDSRLPSNTSWTNPDSHDSDQSDNPP